MQICLNVPSIVYSNSWMGQTSAIPPTTLFTPSVTGLYRVSARSNVVASSDVVGVSIKVWWDGSSSVPIDVTKAFGVSDNSEGTGGENGRNVFLGTPSIPIQFQIGIGSSGTLDHYDTYLVIEQIL